MVLVPYAGKYFGRKCAYWGEFLQIIRPRVGLGWDGMGKGVGNRWRRCQILTGGTGWAKFMEWKYPVEVVFTSKKTFKAAGAVEAAASL